MSLLAMIAGRYHEGKESSVRSIASERREERP